MEEGIESEQISDNFTCAVCLDVLYKPIVLVCGHVSCFWCCQFSMDMKSESHCPLCRHTYHHFPAICQTLHFLLKKLYPISYNRRNIQTWEVERSTLGFSPNIDSLVTSEEESNCLKNAGQSQTSDHSFEADVLVEPSSTTEEMKSCESSVRTCAVSDVLCVACKQLLFRPVVLNCGHVYCEACITIPTEGMLKCQVCECRHPSGFPKVFRVLDHFLEEQFASEYALRRSTVQLNQEQIQNRILPNEVNTQVPRLAFPTEENFLQWWTVHGSKFHANAGCDVCGMCPIIGDRYRCKDCTESCGYDLCGDCYNTSSDLPGRFNQKHTPRHRLELVKPVMNRNVISRLLRGQLAVVSSIASRNQSSPANGSFELPSPSVDDDDGSTELPFATSGEDQSDHQAPI